jgi:hypothetical protein
LTLYLRGRDLDVTVLTANLGTTPSSAKMRGADRMTSHGPVKAKVAVWVLGVEAATPSGCVDSLAIRLGGRLPDLSQLPGVEEAFLDMFVTFEPGKDAGSETELEWNSGALQQLAGAKIPLLITFAVVGL